MMRTFLEVLVEAVAATLVVTSILACAAAVIIAANPISFPW